MKHVTRKFIVFLLLLPTVFITGGSSIVEASFGITPPYVSNTSLIRNSIYEQQILLVRGDPNIGQKAEITIDAPEIQGWIEIVEGTSIALPRGVQKVPMTVKITVPEDAEFKDYKGAIRIKTLPEDGQIAEGAVSISLGALVDIELSVIDKEIKDFSVRRISVEELNEGRKFAWLFFPGKVKFNMSIENTGNVDVAPSKVELKIYDRAGAVLLEETKNIGRIDKVKPYNISDVTAEIPTRLPAGSYVGRYRILNDEEVKQEGDLSLSILPQGTLQTAGFGFIGLSLAHKISLLLPIFTLLIAGLYIIKGRRQRRIRS